MTYRLLIDVSVTNAPKYAPYLQSREAARGIECTLLFSIRNLGKAFPGGTINSLTYFVPQGMARLRGTYNTNIKVPKIRSQKVFTFQHGGFLPISTGPAQVSFTIETQDEEKIEYIQTEEGEEVLENATCFIYVVERTMLDLLALFQERRGEKTNE